MVIARHGSVDGDRHAGSRPAVGLTAAIGVGLLALGLALWRLMPGVGFWDTAEFQMVGPVMGTAHPTGYPSYILVGWLASVLLTPIGEAALRMNVLSAVLLAVAMAVTTDLGRRLTGSVILGVVAGIGTTLTPIVWAIGTHADPHALHVAFVALILWLLVRWEHRVRGNPIESEHDAADGAADGSAAGTDRLLLAAAVVTGLSVGNHSLTLLLGPPILLFVLATDPGILRRPRFIGANVLAFVIPTVLVRFEMVLRAGWLRAPFVYADPSTWTGFWYVTLGAQFHSWLTDPFGDAGGRLRGLVDIAAAQFGPVALLILVAAIVSGFRQPRYAILTGTAMVLTLFFNSVYPDGAIDRYYIGPALIAWTWLAILARTVVDVILPATAWPGQGIGLRPAARWAATGLVGLALLVPSASAFSTRATLVDDSADVAAQVWTNQVLASLEPNAVVVSWWSYSTPLWYAQVVDDRRPDVCIIDDRTRLDYDLGELDQVIARYLPARPVYLIRNGDSELPALAGRYDVTPVGLPSAPNLLRVTAIASSDQVGRGTSPVLGRAPATGAPEPGTVADTPALREDCP
ncbi:MAG TPA: DUF2723 domain-containing protein [Candidatus Limnocylindrales bacterium]|nr:DUF2723 domain-containing protein [Candidatus Limnocylindrales bacterium]